MGDGTRGTLPHLSHFLPPVTRLLLLLPLLSLHVASQTFSDVPPSPNRILNNIPSHAVASHVNISGTTIPGSRSHGINPSTGLGDLVTVESEGLTVVNPQATQPDQNVVVLLGQPALPEGRFFRGMFTASDQCSHNGLTGSCEFRLWCLIQRDKIIVDGKCGSYWYSCCVPNVASVRSDAIRQIAQFRETPRHNNKNEVWRRYRPRPFPHSPRSWGYSKIPVRVGPGPRQYGRYSPVHNRLHPEEVYNEPECGVQRISQFSKRIIGGDEARFGEFPWQAHIRIAGFQCGGVLLNHFFVATAAHCVHKARLPQITVHLGEFDTKDTGKYSEPYPKETFSVIEKRIHPSFKYMLTQPDRFDIAVLRLNRPAIYRENILPICLPDVSDDFTGKIGVVAGWGKTDNSFGKTGTNILRKVDVPIITNTECLRWHHHKGIDVKLHYEMFCAGHAEGQRDACLGDSGGPLVVYDKQRWVLAGITSAGFGCAVDHQPGIYHKVSITSSWLTANLRP